MTATAVVILLILAFLRCFGFVICLSTYFGQRDASNPRAAQTWWLRAKYNAIIAIFWIFIAIWVGGL